MNTSSSKSLDSGGWRDLYKAALFEVDKTRLPDRITRAEEALVVRARELFTWRETTSKRNKLLMTRCTPCMLCGTDHKLAIA
jgi:hypothetical protein